jgi:hypothetical protein
MQSRQFSWRAVSKQTKITPNIEIPVSMATMPKPLQAADSLVCKPDVLTFSVNCLTKCSFASTVLYNCSNQACNFSVSPPLEGVFRIDPQSGVLKEGQCITLCVTLLHSQLQASERTSTLSPGSFVFDSVKILEGQGCSINFKHVEAAAPPPRLPPPPSGALPVFPPVRPGHVILMGNLNKVNSILLLQMWSRDCCMQESNQNKPVFEESPIMKLRHVQLYVAADGNGAYLMICSWSLFVWQSLFPFRITSTAVFSRGLWSHSWIFTSERRLLLQRFL